MELRRGTFEILVDGEIVGSVYSRQTAEAAIDPGRHTVRVRSGRYSSHARSVEVGEHEVVTFRCSGARIWPVYLASFLKPDLALTLKIVGRDHDAPTSPDAV